MDLDFGFCLWLKIPKNNQLFQLFKQLQYVSDFQFSPHITIEYDISNNKEFYITKWKNILENPLHLKVEHPLRFIENEYKGFHSLELPIICMDQSGIDVIKKSTGLTSHLSFAYKLNKPFNMVDKVYVYKILNMNYFENLNINPILAIEHCHCNRINDWHGVNLQ